MALRRVVTIAPKHHSLVVVRPQSPDPSVGAHRVAQGGKLRSAVATVAVQHHGIGLRGTGDHSAAACSRPFTATLAGLEWRLQWNAFFQRDDVVLIQPPRQRSALLAPASPQTRVTNAERRGRVDRRVRSRRGERTARSALSRLRHPSRGKISHGGSLAARAGKSAQTPRRTAPPLCLVDVMRRRPVGDRRRHRSGRDMVRTLNSNS